MLMFLVVLAAAAPPATKGWTFCIAEAGDDIFVTDVFEAALDREKLEALYDARLHANGVSRAVIQCPAPLSERTQAVNAQFTAIAFQRNLQRRLHPEPPLTLRR